MDKLYQNKEWLEEQVLRYKTGAEIARQNNIPVTCVNRYIRKYKLIERSYSTRVARNSVDVDYFKVIDTEIKAYWLGFIMADGCIYSQKRASGFAYSMPLKLQIKDLNHLNKLKKEIKFSGNISHRTQIRTDTPREYCELKVNNTEFCNNLIAHGVVPKKTGKEYISDTIPQELIKHFLRGFFDGDGSIGDNKINVCCSERMLLDIKNVMKSIGISDYKSYEEKGVNVLCLFKKESRVKLMHFLYDNANIYLDRKYDKVKEILLKYNSPLVEQSTNVRGLIAGSSLESKQLS